MSSSFRVSGILSLDGSNFQAGLKRAEIATERFAHHLTSEIGSKLAGLFAVGALEEFTRRTIETADALVVAAKRMGTTVEQVQILKQVAKDSNVELDAMTKAFEKISTKAKEALSGSKMGEALKSRFAKFGVTEDMLHSMTGQELFQGPMAAAAASMSVQDATALLAPILGKGAGPIVQVLQSDMEEVGNQLKKLGALMSTETAVSLKMMKDEAELVSQILLSRFAPAILSVTEAIYKMVGGLAGWWAFLKTYFTPNAREQKLIEAHSIVPGFGGWSPGQKELRDKLIKEADAMPQRNAFEDAMNAAGDEVKKWSDGLADIKARVKGESDRIRNPIAMAGEGIIDASTTSKGKIPSDSVVGIGNFLGAGMAGAMQRIAEAQLSVLETIADKLDAIEANTSESIDSGFGGDT